MAKNAKAPGAAPKPRGFASPAQDIRPNRARALSVVVLFLAAGVASYFNSFRAPFHFDDQTAILENSRIRSLWPLWEPLNSPRDTAAAGRPILSLTLAVNYVLGGYNVAGYHASNLAIHILAALALFGIVRRSLLTPRLRNRFQSHSFTLALAVSLLWMLHPLQTESVTYIIQRAESLVGLFFLITLYCAIRGFESPGPKPWFIAAVISCALGMGSKEVMVSAPLLVWLYDRTFVSGTFRGALERSRGLYLGLASTWLILGTIVASTPRSLSAGFGFTDVTPFRYAVTQPQVVLHYLKLAFWPSGLCFYYDWPLLTTLRQGFPFMIPLTALFAWTLWAIARNLSLGFPGALFFMILAPSSSFLPIATEIAAEHRMYLPLAALISAVVLGGFALFFRTSENKKKNAAARSVLDPVYALAVVAIAAVALGFQSYRRNEDYRDALTLWSDTVHKQPWNSVAHGNLAAVLSDKGRMEEALSHYLEAVRLRPDNVQSLLGVAHCLVDAGRPGEAVPYSQKALKLRPDDEQVQYGISRSLIALGRIDEAIRHLEEALRIKPTMVDAMNNLGIALSMSGKTEEAISRYREALRIDPESHHAHNGLGNALIGRGRFQEALDEYSAAARINPGDPPTRANLAAAYYALGRYAEAWSEIQACRRLGGQPPERLVSLVSSRVAQPK